MEQHDKVGGGGTIETAEELIALLEAYCRTERNTK